MVTGLTPLASAIALYDMPWENDASISFSLPVSSSRSSSCFAFASLRILANTRRTTSGGTCISPAATTFWARLALLNRSQNWLAQEIGISSGYMSKLVTAGRAPSGRIRRRMLKALGFEDFHELFKLDEEEQDGDP